MRLTYVILVVLFASVAASETGHSIEERTQALSPFLGHWEGSGTFSATKMSEAGKVHSVIDCAWSPQQQTLICDQTITDTKGIHHQLTVYASDVGGPNYTFYTVATPGKPAFAGSLTINGNVWTYTGPPDSAGKFPAFRTTNTFKNSDESFRVEFTENGTDWTLMLEGTMHHSK